MTKSRNISFVTYFSWGLAFFMILILNINLFFQLPNLTSEEASFQDNDHQSNQNPISTSQDNPLINQKCCIVTIFDSSSIKQTISLGYSIFKSYKQNSSKYKPKLFALFKHSSIKPIEITSIEKYFSIINITIEEQQLVNDMDPLLFWTNQELKTHGCFPIVGLTNLGVFHKNPTEICNHQPFSAVSSKGDVVFFDPSLMVLDPSQNPMEMTPISTPQKLTFQKYINNRITNWTPMSTALSVDDYNNEYLDFWLKYSSPTFVHFQNDVFVSAVNGKNQSTGSPGLYAIIKKNVEEAMKANPEINLT